MTKRLILSGEVGVDFSFRKPPPFRLIELGYTFVVGYVSYNPSKNLLNPQDYIDAGLSVLYVWEVNAGRTNLGGAYGRLDGIACLAQLQKLGYPTDVSVIVANDTNTTATNIQAQMAYMYAFAAAVAPYTIGVYDDTDLAQALGALAKIQWLPNAWSWSGPTKEAAITKAQSLGYHVYQHTGFWIDDQWNVDPNTVANPFYAWGTPRPQPVPVPIGEDMPTIITNDQAAQYPVRGEWKWVLDRPNIGSNVASKRHLGGAEHAAYGSPTGVYLNDAQLNDIPDYIPNSAVVVPPIVVPAPVVTFPNYVVTADLGAAGKIVGVSKPA